MRIWYRPLSAALGLLCLVAPTMAAQVCVYEEIVTEIWHDGEYLGSTTFYEVLYCYESHGGGGSGEGDGNSGGGGTPPNQDPPPNCPGGLTLDYTLTMNYLSAQLTNPTRGRWGNGFNIEANASGMSGGNYEMKVYYHGIGVDGTIQIADWAPGASIEFGTSTFHQYRIDRTQPDDLKWYVGVRYLCEGQVVDGPPAEGIVKMYRDGEYFKKTGDWSTPTEVPFTRDPIQVIIDCAVHTHNYGNTLESEVRRGIVIDLRIFELQTGIAEKTYHKASETIHGVSGENYTISKITHSTTAPIQRCVYDWKGNETGVVNFEIEKFLYSYALTDRTPCASIPE